MILDDVVIAVDGGGSKTDVVAIGLDGSLVAHARGPASNPQVKGWSVVQRVLDDTLGVVLAALEGRSVRATHVFLAGLDLPVELDIARRELAHWGTDGPDVLDNDVFALLRAGTLSPNAVAVVCGTGINAVGVRADGTTSRFPALGALSGDWGGGADIGALALWHAIRAEEGRDAPTQLAVILPALVGRNTVREVVEAVHLGSLDRAIVNRFAPPVFAAADDGDAVAQSIVARQADEIARLVGTSIRRLELLDRRVPVVLGGGVLAARNPSLDEALLGALAECAPLAEPVWVVDRPVAGAGLSALEAAGVGARSLERWRHEARLIEAADIG